MNNTKRSSLGEGKLPMKLDVIEIEPGPLFPTNGNSSNHGGERMLKAKPLTFL